MRRLVLSLVLGLCLSSPARAHDATGELRELFATEWAWDMAQSPEWATQLGDRSHDDKLSDLSPASFAARRNHLAARVLRARGFRNEKLGTVDRTSLEIFITQAEHDSELLRFPVERLALTPFAGPQQDLPVLAQVPAFRTRKHLDDYLARLRAIPRYIDQVIALLEQGRATGWLPPRQPLRGMPATLRSFRAATAERSVFYTPFVTMPASIPAEAQKQLRATAVQLIASAIDPAFEKIAAYVERTYLPSLRDDAAAWSLPDGAAYYQTCIANHTTTRKTADEIHALGLSEVKRLDDELEQLRVKLGFRGKRAEFNQRLRTEARFFYRDGAQLLSAYRDIAKRIDGGLPRLFKTLPRLPYGVMPTPELEAPTSTTAYYRPGSQDDGRAGMFVANLYKPETRPSWEMESLTLHEAVPGHHLQVAIAQELSDLPRFRREGMFTAFVEGWGMYAESLGPELGMYQDPYSKYGQLTYEMWRAVRLVVDTGLHQKKWTRQQAVNFFLLHTAKTQHDIEVEVDRYMSWPGQALAYKIGEQKILALRHRAEKQLGTRFDIRAFHDEILNGGGLPLAVLEKKINRWLARQR